jgi:broad-specificity NMP kinase
MGTNSRLPVLWLCGAPATGKSTVAWQVFSDLADQELCVGYLDIDQIGMLQPPQDADTQGHRFKVDNLAGMVRSYRAAGAQVLVISGVIDPEHGHDFAEAAPDADITFCHLTVDEPTLRERLAARGCPSEAADEAMIMMGGLADALFVTSVIDTTGRDLAGLARDAAALVTAASSTSGTQELPECCVGAVTIIIGPRAVGKSSVSWGMAMRRWVSGEPTVYVDLDQVGFLRPAPSDASLQAANLGVIWRNALSRGANRLIANGMVATNEDLAILRHAVRPAPMQALRLAANPDTLWERIRARSAGGPARLINDDLENAAPEVQRHVYGVAVGQNVEYAASNLGDDVIDTTNLCIEEAVEQALEAHPPTRTHPCEHSLLPRGGRAS